MQDVRVRWAMAVVGVAIFTGGGAALYANRHAPPPVLITNSVPTSSPASAPMDPAPPSAATVSTAVVQPDTSATASNLVYVHVAGAVKHPTLYSLPAGSRVMQAIKAAGGPLNDADLDAVNLAERVQDGEKIYIPRKGATSADEEVSESPPGNAIGHATVVPPAPSLPLTITPIPGVVEPSPGGVHRRGGHGSHSASRKLTDPSEGQIDVNTASAEDLQRLPGIGPALAARIIAFRQQSGGFKTAADLTEVSGIGQKKLAKMLPFVKVR